MVLSHGTVLGVYIFLVIFYFVFIVSTNYLLFINRHRDFLRQRFVPLVVLSQLAALWNGNIDIVGLDVWHKYFPFPCWVRLLQQYTGGPLYMFLIFFRTALTAHKYAVQKLANDATVRLTAFEIFLIRAFSVVRSKETTSVTQSTKDTSKRETVTREAATISNVGNDKHGESMSKHETGEMSTIPSKGSAEKIAENSIIVEDKEANINETVTETKPSVIESTTETKAVVIKEPESESKVEKAKFSTKKYLFPSIGKQETSEKIAVISQTSDEHTGNGTVSTTQRTALRGIEVASFVRTSIIRNYVLGFCAFELFFLFQSYITWHASLNDESCPALTDTARVIMQYCLIILIGVMLYSFRNAEDTIHLKQEMWAANVVEFVCFGFYTLLKYSPSNSPVEMNLGSGFFNLIMYTVENLLTVLFPLLYALRQDNLRSKIAAEYNNNEYGQLRAILDNPTTRKKFRAVILKQLCVENLEFYTTYGKILHTYEQRKVSDEKRAKKRLISDFKRLVATYIEPGSPFELNLPAAIVKNVVKRFKSDDVANVDSNELKPVYLAVLEMMQANTLPYYKKESVTDA